MFISVILLISCSITPLNFAFSEELEAITWYMACGYAIDIFFALEIVINFNSAFINKEGEQIDDRKEICSEYLGGWFFVDLISIIPLDVLLIALSKQDGEVKGGDAQMNGMVRMSKFSKLYKLVKITRLLRLFKLLK